MDEHQDFIFGRLASGESVFSARFVLVDYGLMTVDRNTGAYVIIEEQDLPIFGDSSTRIKSVYTGNDSPPIGWFREL